MAAALRRRDPAAGGGGPLARPRARWRPSPRSRCAQIRPAAAAGGLLVALYVLSDFGAVSILRYDAFTRAIYTSLPGLASTAPRPPVLGCVLVALTVA